MIQGDFASMTEPGAGLVDGGGNVLADPAAERALIGYLIANPWQIEAATDEVSAEDFFDPYHRQLFKLLRRGHEEGWTISASSLASALGASDSQELVESIVAGAPTELDPGGIARGLFEASERRAVGDANDTYISGAPFHSRMGLKRWADQNDPGESYEYLVEDLIPERELCLMMGESQTGKSFLGYHLGMSVARGRSFFGRRIIQPRGVIWLAYEAERGATARMRAYRKYHDLPLEDVPFAVLQKPAKLWPAEDANAALVAEINGIARAYFGAAKLGLVIVDTHNAGTPGASEIDSEATSRIRENYKRIVTATDAAVMLIGHTNAIGKHRGNEQLTNNIETTLRVSRKVKPISSKESISVKDEEGRAIRSLKVQKQREGQDGDEFDFVLHVVEDGTKNKFGKARTSCVVAPPVITEMAEAASDAPADQSKASFGVRATGQERMFVTCLIEALASKGVVPPRELQLPASVSRVVDYDAVRHILGQKMLREDDDTEEGRKLHQARVKMAVKRTRERMMQLHVVGCHAPFIWWTGKAVSGVPATQRRRDLFVGGDDATDAPDMTEFY